MPEDTEFYTSYIEIARVFERYSASSKPLYDVATVLITRNDDSVLDDYGIRQLVDRLPENTSLNINRLINNYRIIGL